MDKVSVPSLLVGFIFACARWRIPAIPKICASLGAIAGVGVAGAYYVPSMAIDLYIVAVLVVAALVGVLEWRIAKMKLTFKNCAVDAEMKSFIQGGSIDVLKIHDSNIKVNQLLRDTKIRSADVQRSKIRQRKPK